MNNELDVSVVISTYNRCQRLPTVLTSVLSQQSEGVRYEVIVVDNNSTDETRQVVESYIAQSHISIRYVFEEKQGVSHARNTGIAQAQAPIIAFFDDDERVAPDWIATIKRSFDRHKDVDCVGGKVLPQWPSEQQQQPPTWLLMHHHWAPLALQDYGDAPFYVNADPQVYLISANLAFRRLVFEQIGGFAIELQRVKDGIGSMEDHELMLRFFAAGRQGLYEPSLVAVAPVEPERMTRAYHRRWHTGHGHHYAIMRLEELEVSSKGRLFDVSLYLYKKAATNAFLWLKHSLLGNGDAAFRYETQLRFFTGFLRKRRHDYFAGGQRRSTIGEIASVVRSLATGQQR